MDLTSTAEFNYDRLLELAKQGSNETVEVRAKVASARKLADLIASFAHQQGGFIIFGYNTRKRKILGCRMAKLQRRFEEAVKMLGDMRFSTVSFQYS